jgi:FtsP/CotA-like multicopper oxidase with cupredoxin domain
MQRSSACAAVILLWLVACVPADEPPRVITHGNQLPAGHWSGDTLSVSLEVKEGRWYALGENGHGEVVQAFATQGGPPLIPGPLLRVREGTLVHVRLVNPLDSTLIVSGLHTRPGSPSDTVHVAPHDARELSFQAGAPGTYFYWGTTTNSGIEERLFHDSMLAGAFVIDSAGAPAVPADRVFVIGNWEAPVDTAGPKPWVPRDMMVLNGKSWPETERFDLGVGDTLTWRWVNPTANAHPMHLHGTYFTVTSRGTWSADTVYAPADERLVVTEMVAPGGTFAMRWTPEHPGNWLFHCHFSFHISHYISFALVPEPEDPGAPEAVDYSVMGMRGMILGLTVRESVRAGSSATRPGVMESGSQPRRIRLDISETQALYGDEPGYEARISPVDATLPLPHDSRMGDPIILRRGEAAAITVVNHMRSPTAIHWHGMELLSYSDGVPGWSGAAGRIAGAIQPADSFIARMQPPRAGTFIYHSHSNEGYQISAGIYGPLIVLDPGELPDPERDRFFVAGGNGRFNAPGRINGELFKDTVRLHADSTYRFRFIDINPDFRVFYAVCRGAASSLASTPADSAVAAKAEAALPADVPPEVRALLRWAPPSSDMCELSVWKAIAKDGADLPRSQAVEGRAWIGMGPGETADYAFTAAPGDYTLVVVTQVEGWTQRVPIRVR